MRRSVKVTTSQVHDSLKPYLPFDYITIKGAVYTELYTDTIAVPVEYQRELKLARAKRMAKHFNPMAVDPITVSHRGGGAFVVVNGQHRKTVSQLLAQEGDRPTVAVRIIGCKDAAEEANVFTVMGLGTKSISPNDVFRARVAAKDPIALLVIDQLHKIGVMPRYTSGQPKPNETTAAPAFYQMAEDLGERKFKFAIAVLNYAYRRPDDSEFIESSALKSDFIQGLRMFFKATTVRTNSIRLGLRYGPVAAKILDEAYRISTSAGGESRRRCIAREIENGMNAGLAHHHYI